MEAPYLEVLGHVHGQLLSKCVRFFGVLLLLLALFGLLCTTYTDQFTVLMSSKVKSYYQNCANPSKCNALSN